MGNKASSTCPVCGKDTPHVHAPIIQGYITKVTRLQTKIIKLEQLLYESMATMQRIESAVDWHLGRSLFTQSNHLQGFARSQEIRKELYDAHDETRELLAKLNHKPRWYGQKNDNPYDTDYGYKRVCEDFEVQK